MLRNCYCKADQKYCGKCDVCGNPGHISHHPGAVPATGSWCDQCYEREYFRCKSFSVKSNTFPRESRFTSSCIIL